MEAPRRVLADIAAARGIRDRRLLEAMRQTPRVRFVPPEHADLADLDVPVPIGHEQVTTQPTLVAAMLDALELRGHERVLEVGSGYGYQTALLAQLAGYVWGVERWADLATVAEANLTQMGITNVQIVAGDGSEGLRAHAPFDAIVLCAAFPQVPPPLVEQLAVGGRLVQPIGPGGEEEVTLFVKQDARLVPVRRISYAHFVPLIGSYGFPP
jgi:protein-L-isoaspartate(D-aspartate) O-methyltransferase